MAPTQSTGVSSVGFINNTEECAGAGWHKLAVDASTSVGGVKFTDTSSTFMHVVLTVDPRKDEVKIFLDANQMSNGTMNSVFGVPIGTPPQLPSFHNASSFNYDTKPGLKYTIFKDGPTLNTYFTPWILGGGYTDGLRVEGGFMGTYGGRVSGLRGNIGGFKIYTKPLTSSEVKKNYDGQKDFFKNIKV